MELAEGPAKAVRVGGNDDRVDVVGHQAIAPDLDPRALGRLREEVEIERVVGLLEEGLLPTVAALGYMMRQAGDDETRKTSHKGREGDGVWGLSKLSP
jgi:hypothetical protein